MKKPRFYYMDLINYTDDFLREIIMWQKERIEELENQTEHERLIEKSKKECQEAQNKEGGKEKWMNNKPLKNLI